MPKVKILRPDGASLSSVYESKTQDTWSLILKQQLVEEQEMNLRKKEKRYQQDAMYGKLLHDQEIEKKRLDSLIIHKGDVLANSTEGVVSRYVINIQLINIIAKLYMHDFM